MTRSQPSGAHPGAPGPVRSKRTSLTMAAGTFGAGGGAPAAAVVFSEGPLGESTTRSVVPCGTRRSMGWLAHCTRPSALTAMTEKMAAGVRQAATG